MGINYSEDMSELKLAFHLLFCQPKPVHFLCGSCDKILSDVRLLP